MPMASPNEYRGYIKLPKEKLSDCSIRLDFNGHVDVQPRNASLRGFSLRMSVPGKHSNDEQSEMSITLTPEQWLDLVDAMKAEFESVQKARKGFDDIP
jgi:hypothetical protein